MFSFLDINHSTKLISKHTVECVYLWASISIWWKRIMTRGYQALVCFLS